MYILHGHDNQIHIYHVSLTFVNSHLCLTPNPLLCHTFPYYQTSVPNPSTENKQTTNTPNPILTTPLLHSRRAIQPRNANDPRAVVHYQLAPSLEYAPHQLNLAAAPRDNFLRDLYLKFTYGSSITRLAYQLTPPATGKAADWSPRGPTSRHSFPLKLACVE